MVIISEISRSRPGLTSIISNYQLDIFIRLSAHLHAR